MTRKHLLKELSLNGLDLFLSQDGKRAVIDSSLGLLCYEGKTVNHSFRGSYKGFLDSPEDAKSFILSKMPKDYCWLEHPKRNIIPDVFTQIVPRGMN